jgi:hypothetical protein
MKDLCEANVILNIELIKMRVGLPFYNYIILRRF